jgi:hypothetical protein
MRVLAETWKHIAVAVIAMLTGKMIANLILA